LIVKTPKPRILIADDEAGLRHIVKMRLECCGYRCLEAKNGREAMEMARSEHPSLIVMDLMMPDMNGFEAAKAIRQDMLKPPKIILFTAQTPEEIMSQDPEALENIDFIFKPFDSKALSLLVEEVLARR